MAPELEVAGGVLAVSVLVQLVTVIRWSALKGHVADEVSRRLVAHEEAQARRDEAVDGKLTAIGEKLGGFAEHLAELNGLLCGLGLDVRPARKRM